MRHLKKGRKFGQKAGTRKALLKSLVSALILKEKIKTTEAKAKETRGLVEKFITKAKKGDLSSRRFLIRYLPQKVVKKLMEEISPRHKERRGGYTRIIKLGLRKKDAAKMAIIEIIK